MFKIVSMLKLSIQAYNIVKSRCFLILLLIRIFSSLNLFQLPLFVLSKVNVTFLRYFLGLYCLFKHITWLTHNAFFISMLFRIVSSLNNFQLSLLVLSKLNVTCLR